MQTVSKFNRTECGDGFHVYKPLEKCPCGNDFPKKELGFENNFVARFNSNGTILGYIEYKEQ